MVKLPAGACNAHCHVFGPRERFPYAPDAAYVPQQDAPKEALFALNDRLGLQRCVVVQSACHGFDNRATEDAVAARPDDYRGIALLPTDVDDAELRRLDARGFRGVRFNFMGHLGQHTPVADILARWITTCCHSSSSPSPVRPEQTTTGGLHVGDAGDIRCRAAR